MMMPANYSAIAENEMTYVVGGGLLEAIGSVTAPVWGAANVKTFNTNLLTILSNTFTKHTVAATMGTMFSGNWGKDGKQLFGDDGSVNKLFTNQFNDAGTDYAADEMNFGNKVMRALGVAASVYTLGTTPVKNYISETVVGINGIA